MSVSKFMFLFFIVGFVGLVQSDGTCPPSEDVEPCTCSESSIIPVTYSLSCSSATSLNDIERACQADYGTNLLSHFSMLFNYDVHDFDRNIFGNLSFQSMYFYDMNITSLTGDFFQNSLNTLQNLTIEDTNLKSFPYEILSSMTELDQLKLYSNKLTKIPKLTCGSPVRSISFDESQINEVEDEAFNYCQELESISLYRNSLPEISTGNSFDTHSKLTKLTLLMGHRDVQRSTSYTTHNS